MQISNKPELISETVSRVVNNAPISEILRVYSESLRLHLDGLSDEDFVKALSNAGFTDLIEAHIEGAEDSENEE